ncbi:MAG: hypothetical protein ING71_17345 [Rhodocyclaceae bacterium]|nr:hypothetical protein [Rhodocyclaceae bacterium]
MRWPGWRWIADGIRIGAPIPLTLFAGGLVFILWLGNWPLETAEQRIQFLGIGMLLVLGLLGLSLFLGRQGISSLSVKGPGGMEVNINEKDKADD